MPPEAFVTKLCTVRAGSLGEDMAYILVVDDDAETRTLLTVMLESGRNSVLSVRDGMEALRALDAMIPDVVVTDWKMPVIDGIELCRLIRAKERYRELPILILTGHGEIPGVESVLELGSIEHVRKSTDWNAFRTRLQAVLARGGHR